MVPSADGILALDKPAGISSARALDRVKRALRVRKAGHAGTLDPFAVGLLICCVGSATRLARFFLHGDKRYEAVLRLGVDTDTQDATGTVVARHPVPDLPAAALEALFGRFEGEILQAPPAYSALKHDGVPLYRLARAGRPVQKPPRPVRIHRLRIRSVRLPEIRFEVACSGGTYVRTLCADIGREMGCGGHLQWLRRTFAGGFDIAESVPLEALEASDAPETFLVRPADALRGMSEIRVEAAAEDRIRHGQPLSRRREEARGYSWPVPPGGGGEGRYLKAVAGRGRLLAVVRETPGDETFSYCCVFPDA